MPASYLPPLFDDNRARYQPRCHGQRSDLDFSKSFGIQEPTMPCRLLHRYVMRTARCSCLCHAAAVPLPRKEECGAYMRCAAAVHAVARGDQGPVAAYPSRLQRRCPCVRATPRCQNASPMYRPRMSRVVRRAAPSCRTIGAFSKKTGRSSSRLLQVATRPPTHKRRSPRRLGAPSRSPQNAAPDHSRTRTRAPAPPSSTCGARHRSTATEYGQSPPTSIHDATRRCADADNGSPSTRGRWHYV